jgi:hypothetical protein
MSNLIKITDGIEALTGSSLLVSSVKAGLAEGRTYETIKTIYEQSLDNRPLVSKLLGEDLLKLVETYYYDRNYNYRLTFRVSVLA